MSDLVEIWHLVHRLARALDQLDPEAMERCFAPGSLPDGSTQNAVTFHARFEQTMHLILNPAYEVSGESARGGSYCLVRYVERTDLGLSMFTTHALYRDELIRFEGRWLFVNRNWSPIFSTEPVEVTDGAPRLGLPLDSVNLRDRRI